MTEPLRPTEVRRLEEAITELTRRRREAAPQPNAISPRPRRTRRTTSTLIDVRLDPAQRGVVQLPPGRSVLVLGEAGHGKTTVALHRLAYLHNLTTPTPRTAVIVPTEGLVRLIQPLMRRLGVDVAVETFDGWARAQARRVFRDLPKRESEDTTPGVSRLKRDPALRVALRELAKRPPGRIDDDRDARVGRSRAHARRGDLQHLFGDRELLEKMASASGAVTPRMIEDVLEHTRIQFQRPAEVEFAHVTDRKRLVAVDGRPIDQGTALGDARTVDSEDYAVLFELDRMRAGERDALPSEPSKFDLILIDEAQELAPIEFALVGRSLQPGGTLIVAGDDAQQIDPSVTFTSWEASMNETGLREYETVNLEVGYRCPPHVVDIARSIVERAGRAPRMSLTAPPVVEFPDEFERAAWLAVELTAIADRDPGASTIVLCRSALDARRLASLLRGSAPLRWVTDGRFRSKGNQLAVIDDVKGLEFDNVIVADAGATAYPGDATSRRALYVATTRTRHELVFLSVGPRTPILRVAPPRDE